MEPIVIVALVTAAASVVGSAIVALSSRGKTRADAKSALDARIDARVSQQLTEAWARIDSQEEDARVAKREFKEAVRYIIRLRAHIESGKGTPAPQVPTGLVDYINTKE